MADQRHLQSCMVVIKLSTGAGPCFHCFLCVLDLSAASALLGESEATGGYPAATQINGQTPMDMDKSRIEALGYLKQESFLHYSSIQISMPNETDYSMAAAWTSGRKLPKGSILGSRCFSRREVL